MLTGRQRHQRFTPTAINAGKNKIYSSQDKQFSEPLAEQKKDNEYAEKMKRSAEVWHPGGTLKLA